MADKLQDAYDDAVKLIARLNKKLAEDALDPKKSYMLDGESVDRDKWRRTLMQNKKDAIAELKELDILINGIPLSVNWAGKTDDEKLDYDARN